MCARSLPEPKSRSPENKAALVCGRIAVAGEEDCACCDRRCEEAAHKSARLAGAHVDLKGEGCARRSGRRRGCAGEVQFDRLRFEQIANGKGEICD